MQTLSQEEFEKKYGKQVYAQFGKQIATTSIFNTQAAKTVWSRAADDIAFAKAQSVANKITGQGDINLGAKTAIVQGGLAPFRSVAAGLTGDGTVGGNALQSADIGGKLITAGNFINKNILPPGVSEKIGQTALDTIGGFQGMSQEKQLEQRNLLGIAEGMGGLLGTRNPFRLKPELPIPASEAKYVLNPGETVFTGATETSTKKVATNTIVEEAKALRESIQATAGEKSVNPFLGSSAARLVEDKPGSSIVARYDAALAQAVESMSDTYKASPIEAMGSDLGDAFMDVIKQQRAVGAALGSELDQWGKLRVSISSTIENALKQMDDSGLSYNPRTNQFTSFQGNAFAESEVTQLSEFFSKMRLLGDAPSVRQIDQFISRTNSELSIFKESTGLTSTTNAERIIKTTLHNLRESLNPEVNGITQLQKYWDANKTYGKLKTFTKEGEKFLGKRTQAGDFARDASVAKSAVQSILNGGKKDWLIALEELTGYPALDNAVLALQAMKDAGDFKGLSLLQAIKEQGIPTSKAGIVGAIIDKAADAGKRTLLGNPEEQTRAFLRSIEKAGVDLKVASRPIQAKASIPKTEKLIKIEKDIKKNVKAQEAAIARKDWPLVAKLKKKYQELKQALLDEIKFIKDNMGSEAGFANFTGGKAPDLKKQSVKTVDKKISKIVADMTEEDAAILRILVENKLDTTPLQTERVLKAMGLDKLPYSEQKELATKILKGYDERWGGVDEVGVATTRSGALDIKKPTSLLEEAKGKTLEEFMKAQGTPLYHGTKADFTEFRQSTSGEIGKGVYFYDSKTKAADYVGEGGRVVEAYFDGKLATMDDFRKTRDRLKDNSWTNSDTIDELSRRGYVGIIRPEGNSTVYNIFDPKNIKTKESLEDIWKKANGKELP